MMKKILFLIFLLVFVSITGSSQKKISSNRDYSVYNSGSYIDLIIGGGNTYIFDSSISSIFVTLPALSSFARNFNLGLSYGKRIYFTDFKVWRPGLDIRYARANVNFGRIILGGSFAFGIDYQVGVGFTNGFKINDVMGVELAFGISAGLYMRLQNQRFYTGALIPSLTTNIKFRYKDFAFGIDIHNQVLGLGFIGGRRYRGDFFGVSIGKYF